MHQASQSPGSPQPTQAPQARTITTPRASGGLLERSEIDLLQMRRNELERQLDRIRQQREALAAQRQNASSQTAAALDARLAILDERSARLEGEIFATDDAITAGLSGNMEAAIAQVARRAAEATTVQVLPRGAPVIGIGGNASEELIGALVATNAIGLVLMGIVFWTILRRRLAKLAPQGDQSARIAQLQQSIDVVALEVERISEGQRYVSKLLNDKAPAAANRVATGDKR